MDPPNDTREQKSTNSLYNIDVIRSDAYSLLKLQRGVLYDPRLTTFSSLKETIQHASAIQVLREAEQL